jgi:hypothetical protein
MSTKAPRHRQPWTNEDDKELQALYGTMATKFIAEKVGRSVYTVQNRISFIGLTHRPTKCVHCGKKLEQAAVGRPRTFCGEDTECGHSRRLEITHEREPLLPIQAHPCDECKEDFVARINVRYCSKACSNRAWNHKQQSYHRYGLTIADPSVRAGIQALLAEDQHSLREIARRTGTSVKAVTAVKRGGTGNPPSPWTPERIQYVLDNVGRRTSAQMAEELGLRISQVDGKIHTLRKQNRLARPQ